MITLTENYVLVEKTSNNTIDSTLYVPETQEKIMKGKVIEIGEGKKTSKGLIPMTVKQNHVVYFAFGTGTDIRLNDKEYIIIEEDNILAFEEK